MTMKCPTCKRPLAAPPAERSFAPFCSDRCRLADLGSWLDGAYRIGAPLSETDLDEGLPTQGGDGDGDGEN
jgi:endogenous inhibitor of DNA gyrase (YacG/DUF329 family)